MTSKSAESPAQPFAWWAGLARRQSGSLVTTAAKTAAGIACAVSFTLLGSGAAWATDRAALLAPQARTPEAPVGGTPWARLSPEQRTFLAPLQNDWMSIDGTRQQRWLQLASRAPTLPADERLRIQQRMATWSQLTPERRNQARMQFIEAQKLPAPQRQARWQEYQALSADEKKALAQQAKVQKTAPVTAGAPERGNSAAAPRMDAKKDAKVDFRADDRPSAAKSNLVHAPPPSVSKAVTATALQARPGATTRPLNTPAVPPAHNQPGLPKIAATEGFVDPATLLPKRGPQGAAMRSALTAEKPAKP